MKDSLLGYSYEELAELMKSLSVPSYRAKQILENLYAGKSFDGMSNIPASLRTYLNQNYLDVPVAIEKKFYSRDGTVKYLFRLSDGELAEGVLMTYAFGKTLCISTQIGCRMGCVFCASGLDGLKRNLSAAEMIGQVLTVNRDSAADSGKDRAVTNVVLMGSGEPLDNFDNTDKFLTLISLPYTLNISRRNISLSTSGIPDKIRALADKGYQFNLTVSLHAPNDALRSVIMPVNKKYGIESLLASARYYFEKTRRRLIFEYSLIDGLNDGTKHALELCGLLSGLPCHVNLIRLNKVDGKSFQPSRPEAVKAFRSILEKRKISNTLRRIMGADIEGACGQLRRRYESNGGAEKN